MKLKKHCFIRKKGSEKHFSCYFTISSWSQLVMNYIVHPPLKCTFITASVNLKAAPINIFMCPYQQCVVWKLLDLVTHEMEKKIIYLFIIRMTKLVLSHVALTETPVEFVRKRWMGMKNSWRSEMHFDLITCLITSYFRIIHARLLKTRVAVCRFDKFLTFKQQWDGKLLNLDNWAVVLI